MLKTLIILPTYNEKDNISDLIDDILKIEISMDRTILVVDDDSPDKTWAIVEKKAESLPGVKLLRRLGKRGRGAAGIEAFKWALQHGYDYIIEMDADYSHSPVYIPAFLSNITTSDVVIGSRFLEPGADSSRGCIRRSISRLAGFFIRKLWHTDISDPTSGYRCFNRTVVDKLVADGLCSDDQLIVLEVLAKILKHGFTVNEIPIIFDNRRAGRSKLSPAALIKCFIGSVKLKT